MEHGDPSTDEVLPTEAPLALSPNGKIIADESGRLWSVATGREAGNIPFLPYSQPPNAITFSPDGKLMALVTGDNEGIVHLYDVDSGRQVGTISQESHDVISIAFSPNGKLLATGNDDRTLQFWDVATRKAIGPALSAGTGTIQE